MAEPQEPGLLVVVDRICESISDAISTLMGMVVGNACACAGRANTASGMLQAAKNASLFHFDLLWLVRCARCESDTNPVTSTVKEATGALRDGSGAQCARVRGQVFFGLAGVGAAECRRQ